MSTTRKSAAKKAPATKPAKAKATPKAKATTPAPAPKATPLTDKASKQLVAAQAAMAKATEAFEAAVVEQLAAGVSPSHVAAALDLAGSSVRRIGWRHGVGTPPPAERS